MSLVKKGFVLFVTTSALIFQTSLIAENGEGYQESVSSPQYDTVVLFGGVAAGIAIAAAALSGGGSSGTGGSSGNSGGHSCH